MTRIFWICLIMTLLIGCGRKCDEPIILEGKRVIPRCCAQVSTSGKSVDITGVKLTVPLVKGAQIPIEIGTAKIEPKLIQEVSELVQVVDRHRMDACQSLQAASSTENFNQYLSQKQADDFALEALHAILIAKVDAPEFSTNLNAWINDQRIRSKAPQSVKADGNLPGILAATTDRIKENEILIQADSLIQNELYFEAVRTLSKHIENHPKSHRAFNIRGTAYQRRGKNEEALSDFKRATELDPKCLEYRYNFAVMLSTIEDFDQAIPIFLDLIKKNPGDASNRFGLAVSYQLKGNTEKAISAYRTLINLNGDLKANAQLNLAEIFTEKLRKDPRNVELLKDTIHLLAEVISKNSHVAIKEIESREELRFLNNYEEYRNMVSGRLNT